MISETKEIVASAAAILSTISAGIAWGKAHVAKRCNDCAHKKRVETDDIVAELKYMARRKLKEIEATMKSNFLNAASNYCEEKDLLNFKPYKSFQSCIKLSKFEMMAVLVDDFYRNHLNEYTVADIEDRSKFCFQQMTDIFDAFYDPSEQPNRIELFEKSKSINSDIMDIIRSIYQNAKEMK